MIFKFPLYLEKTEERMKKQKNSNSAQHEEDVKCNIDNNCLCDTM